MDKVVVVTEQLDYEGIEQVFLFDSLFAVDVWLDSIYAPDFGDIVWNVKEGDGWFMPPTVGALQWVSGMWADIGSGAWLHVDVYESGREDS